MPKEIIKLIVIHALLGVLLKVVPPLGYVYALFIVVIGLYIVIKSSNKNQQVLSICTYIISAEVLLRMLGTSFINEYGKYNVILFCLIGAYYSGLKTNAAFFGMYLLFLLPGVFIGMQDLGHEMDTRKAILFNISGPLALGIASIYTAGKTITQEHLKKILLAGIMPLVTMLMYIILYTPDLELAVINTQSNFQTSGGFGPNQVSTMLGFGMALAGIYTILFAKKRIEIILFGFLAILFAYRCLLTFSRGGFYTGFLMIIFIMGLAYVYGNVTNRVKISAIISVTIGIGLVVWLYASIVTGGLIEKRYANQDALGREKESVLTGREILMETELKMFYENIFLGVGVGRVKETRIEEYEINAASHNEITRLLAEHGTLGLISLFLLIAYPLYSFLNYKPNRVLIILFIFWALTINHAAMRLAAPAFIYALCILNFKIASSDEKNTLHREQTV